jgi:integrase
MATAKLTDKTILAAKATDGGRIELWDEQTPGLCLRVSASEGRQKKVWVWRYRALDGRQPRMTLADYSEQHGLKWAREQVEELRVKVRKGEDPAGELRKKRTQAKAEPLKTFNQLADAFLAASEHGHWKPRKKQKRARTIADERAILKRNVRPVIGELRIEDIERRTIRKLANDLMDRGIGAQTNRAVAVIRQVFAYAVAQERVALNPAIGIDKPATETPRKRTLTDAELKALWNILADPPAELRLPPKDGEDQGQRFYVSRGMSIALQLTMLLLNRRNEIAGMALSELDLDHGTWLIPGERMKGGVPHLVTLPPRSVELIREAVALARGDRGNSEPEFVFPSPRNKEKPIRPDSITHAMAGLCAVLGIMDASPHDLRRTGSTVMTSERLGISPFIRSKVLGHRSDTGGGAAVSMIHYDTNDYAAEKRRALEAWEGLLLQIVGEQAAPSNVTPLARSRPR